MLHHRILDTAKLVELIDRSGKSTASWAREHGFTQQSLSSWITGIRICSNRNISRLAEALGIPVNDLSIPVYATDRERIGSAKRDNSILVAKIAALNSKQRKLVEGLVDELLK